MIQPKIVLVEGTTAFGLDFVFTMLGPPSAGDVVDAWSEPVVEATATEPAKQTARQTVTAAINRTAPSRNKLPTLS